MDFVRMQFDKLLLTGLVMVFTTVAVLAYWRHGEAGLVAFATDQAKLFAGALLTLITGRLIGGKSGPAAGGGNGGAAAAPGSAAVQADAGAASASTTQG